MHAAPVSLGRLEMPKPVRSRRRGVASAVAALVGLWASAASAEVLLFSAAANQLEFFRNGVAGFVDLNCTAAGGPPLRDGLIAGIVAGPEPVQLAEWTRLIFAVRAER